ncbi:28S ribosomal protein S31, mitochondrial [Oopsacas minuta]|uniref:Small ribosomal subunit protein mS31 n=1 Tax=Oopsacas minuta TaxID=111878 RepID=A0AAV7JLK1_9METZ|nr:28S ribosomal protein S31, mitochondrial [Oopsacas minuta]
MLSIRLIYIPKLLPIVISSQIRANSKITHQDKNRNPTRGKISPRDKAFLRFAREGRKLSETDLPMFVDKHSDIVAPIPNQRSKNTRERRKKNANDSFLETNTLNKQLDNSPMKGTKFIALDNLERIRKGEKTDTYSPFKRDLTPLFSYKDRSQLFIKPTNAITLSVQKESPFERDLQESTKFLNSLLYSNPFKDMKEESYDMNYPVNNEDGQPTEKGVSFKDHVILDHFYKDFPKTGEIRNFMELVITGLSQNAYLTPEEKKEHIDWFKKEISTLSKDEIKKMANYAKPKRVRMRRLKIKV